MGSGEIEMTASLFHYRRADDRRDIRRRRSLALLAIIGVTLLVFLNAGLERSFAARATVQLHDTRTCAAVDVYTTATADDWAQRATIARASLNRFAADGVPDCFPDLSTIMGDGLDTYRWQAALDAVDAIADDSYALPLACERVDTVAPLTDSTRVSPLSGALSARSQCVLNGLAFWDSRA